MKLSNKVWIIVGIGIIVVLLAIVFMVYFRQVAEQRDLEDRLDAATARSITLAADKMDLENQLSQAQSLVDTSQAQYPQAIESIEYGEYLFEIAEKCNLSLASLSFPKPGTVIQGSVTYSVVSLSLPVSGALEDIFEFIDIIKTDPRFASTRVKSVNLSVGGGSATIAVDIYGYRR
jgi:type II secretory pathway pseudopilin PulG